MLSSEIDVRLLKSDDPEMQTLHEVLVNHPQLRDFLPHQGVSLVTRAGAATSHREEIGHAFLRKIDGQRCPVQHLRAYWNNHGLEPWQTAC
jgi:hypothetical protein